MVEMNNFLDLKIAGLASTVHFTLMEGCTFFLLTFGLI